MDKGDPLAFSPEAGNLIDKLHTCRTTAIQHRIEIVDRKANVMDSRTSPREEFPDWSIVAFRLEQLDETLARGHSRDARAVRIGELDWRHSEHIAEKRQLTIDRRESNPYVSDSGPFKGFILH